MYKYTINRQIATVPFPTRDLKTVNRGGFVHVQQKTELTALKVLQIYSDEDLHITPGDVVYVSGEDCKAPYAGKVYTMNEEPFILVPKDRVIMVEHQVDEDTPRPDSRSTPDLLGTQ